MKDKLKTIKLYGELGEKFGKEFHLNVHSTAEAIRALRVLRPGFEQELMTSKDRGIGYSIFVGSHNIKDLKELSYPIGRDEICIAPVVMGAKRGGLFQVLLGAAIVVASVYTGGLAGATAGATTAGSFLGVTGGYAIAAQMGMALALGGVVQLLSPQTKVTGTNDGENGKSYSFSGVVNTQAQGNPVPLLYGEMTVGSAVISAGIYAEDQA
jgi:predicted phage tail protein